MFPLDRKKKVLLTFALSLLVLVLVVLRISSVKSHNEKVTSYLETLKSQEENLTQLEKKISLSYVDDKKIFLKDTLTPSTIEEIERKLDNITFSKDKISQSKNVQTYQKKVETKQQEVKELFTLLQSKFTFQNQLATGFTESPIKEAVYRLEVAILPESTELFFLSLEETLAKNFPTVDGWKKLMVAAITGGKKQAQDLAIAIATKERLLAQETLTPEELALFASQIQKVKNSETVRELENSLNQLQEKMNEEKDPAKDLEDDVTEDVPSENTGKEEQSTKPNVPKENNNGVSAPYPLTSYTGSGKKFLKESLAEAAGNKAVREGKAGSYQIITQYFSDGSIVYYLELIPVKEDSSSSSESSTESESTTDSSSESTESTEESSEETSESSSDKTSGEEIPATSEEFAEDPE